MTKRYRIKRVGTNYVLHVKRKVNGRNVWRRVWGYTFYTENMARVFAEGNF